jgi:hypothetical protein
MEGGEPVGQDTGPSSTGGFDDAADSTVAPSDGAGSGSGATADGSGSGSVSESGSSSGIASSDGSGSGSSNHDGSGSSSGGSQSDASSSGSSGSNDAGSGTPDVGVVDAGAVCTQTLPAVTDYSQNGPFSTTSVANTGPDGGYTTYQPATLGTNGFKHPIATWGNGVTTTSSNYAALLGAIASHGFVVVASNSTSVTAQEMTDGLDWMVQQNAQSGPYRANLDTRCLVTIGYSLGGGAAVDAGSHADVVTTVSFHGIAGDSAALRSPLLLFTSTTDTVAVAATFVTPTFDSSSVQTFYATLQSSGDPSNVGHLLPVGDGGPERAPAIAWLRYWVYGDQGARSYFWGSTATLCQSPWQCESKYAGGPAQTSGF